jgi:hypothetical protein
MQNAESFALRELSLHDLYSMSERKLFVLHKLEF